MKQYKVEPITYTNDYKTKIITCKRLNPDKIIYEAYGLSVSECLFSNNRCYVKAGHGSFIISSF